jgi:hypothetical protein
VCWRHRAATAAWVRVSSSIFSDGEVRAVQHHGPILKFSDSLSRDHENIQQPFWTIKQQLMNRMATKRLEHIAFAYG